MSANGRGWITIPNWDRFQHYKDRGPKWIKNYTELMSDDAYRSLSFHQRGVLHSVWMEYARGNRQLRDSTLTLTRQLGHRVTTRDLEALNHAGYITFTASNPTPMVAMPERETETYKEERTSSKAVNALRPDGTASMNLEPQEHLDEPARVGSLIDVSLGLTA